MIDLRIERPYESLYSLHQSLAAALPTRFAGVSSCEDMVFVHLNFEKVDTVELLQEYNDSIKTATEIGYNHVVVAPVSAVEQAKAELDKQVLATDLLAQPADKLLDAINGKSADEVNKTLLLMIMELRERVKALGG